MSKSETELDDLLEAWSRENGDSTNQPYNPLFTLTRIAEIIERETEVYYKSDPDPFDDRHPARANPQCVLGHMMKAVFKNEEFMDKLVSTYIMSNQENSVIIAGVRLALDLLPGLETSVVFQETEGIVKNLFRWSEKASEPLRSYATGLLAGAMEIQDVAVKHKEPSSKLVPLMLQRLRDLQKEMRFDGSGSDLTEKQKEKRHFSMFGDKSPSKPSGCIVHQEKTPEKNISETESDIHRTGKARMKRSLSPSYYSEELFRFKKPRTTNDSRSVSEASNSSWIELESYLISTYSLDPLTCCMKQRLILQYVTPMAEYQELLGAAFENNALDIIFNLINPRENKDGRLAFEALKYCATLLCHKKFAVEFLAAEGIQKLLHVYRPSVAATGASLCFYYLSYFEDAMEMLSILPDHITSDLVCYMLWLIECSHDSSRCHAAMFFSQCFPFRNMLDLFDRKDGLRRLFNVIGTQGIVNTDENASSRYSDDAIYTMRQAARHVSLTLKKYFEAHLSIKADEIRRSHARNDGSPLEDQQPYKPMKLDVEILQENMELLMEYLPIRAQWKPEVEFNTLGGIQLLMQLAALAPSWNNFPGKAETIKNCLDVLAVCTISSRSQLLLLESVTLPDEMATPGISAIIGLTEGDILVAEPDVQKSALNVLINCVCGPVDRLGAGVGRYFSGGSRKKVNHRGGEDILSKMWNGTRHNNGIMSLLSLLSIKTPITDADSIRALACRALLGLARCETVRQIISKLPMFNNGQLQYLMREPVLQDKRQEHVKFCKYASNLLEKVSGKSNDTVSASLEDIRRASIVAQTKINYREKELLQLINDYLLSKGLVDTAAHLQLEAKLPRCNTPPFVHPSNPMIYSPITPKQMSKSVAHTSSSAHSILQQTSRGHNSGFSSPSTPRTSGPIKFTIGCKYIPSPVSAFQNKYHQTESKFSRDNINQNLLVKPRFYGRPPGDMNLDKIVTEYLRKQHALCQNPVSTCPPMSLFQPHRCPVPRGRTSAPSNITSRIFHQSIKPLYGGRDGQQCNRKYIYSKFCPVRTYRDGIDEGISSCTFWTDHEFLILGTFAGDLKFTSLNTAEEVHSFSCHQSAVAHCQVARNGKSLLTSTGRGSEPQAALWKYSDNMLDNVYNFEDNHAEFSNLTQDKIIGTKDETAHIYDVSTGSKIRTLFDDKKANNYSTNMATFHPEDELVLNDGVLWDTRMAKSIHKFDKFNQHISGVFHPMGLEIIINSEVWDIRNFHLLHTVPSLDQCQIKFTTSGDVIFATHIDLETDPEDDRYRSPFGSAFRTFDATNYSHISTMDLKTRSIYDLCVDKFDNMLAVVENQMEDVGTDESICRLYDIGKLRDADDDQLQEEDDDVDDDDDDDDDEDDDLSNLDGGSDDSVLFPETSSESEDEGGGNDDISDVESPESEDDISVDLDLDTDTDSNDSNGDDDDLDDSLFQLL